MQGFARRASAEENPSKPSTAIDCSCPYKHSSHQPQSALEPTVLFSPLPEQHLTSPELRLSFICPRRRLASLPPDPKGKHQDHYSGSSSFRAPPRTLRLDLVATIDVALSRSFIIHSLHSTSPIIRAHLLSLSITRVVPTGPHASSKYTRTVSPSC